METTLIVAQIVFYFTVSIAIIGIGILFGIVVYRLTRISRELEGLSRNLHTASGEVGERIRDIIDNLSKLPVLSYFLRARPPKQNKKRSGSK